MLPKGSYWQVLKLKEYNKKRKTNITILGVNYVPLQIVALRAFLKKIDTVSANVPCITYVKLKTVVFN